MSIRKWNNKFDEKKYFILYYADRFYEMKNKTKKYMPSFIILIKLTTSYTSGGIIL